MSDMAVSPATAALFAELQDLKRLQPAHLDHSIASEFFRMGWRGIIAGDQLDGLALRMTTRALLNILLPGLDERFFRAAKLNPAEGVEIMQRALEHTASGRIAPPLYDELSAQVPTIVEDLLTVNIQHNKVPKPIEILCRQPRAGATHPELPRLVLTPPEMHSDHCFLTAVYGVLLADHYGADRGTVFLAAMAHHLHNAYLADTGFAGEECLGEYLGKVIHNCRKEALGYFSVQLQQQIGDALGYHETIDRPEGKAISAGDVLDRVLDIKWRTKAAAVTDQDILGELDLVHPGPLKNFQTDLLAKTEVWKG